MKRALRAVLLAVAATTLVVAAPATADEPSTYTAELYLDTNGNGKRDTGEEPVEGASVWWCPGGEDYPDPDTCVEQTTDDAGTVVFDPPREDRWDPFIDFYAEPRWAMYSQSDDGQGNYVFMVNDEDVEDTTAYATTGTVYVDEDRDDAMGADEERLAGVELVACHREDLESCLDPVSTDAQGRFDYGDVPRTHQVYARPASDRDLVEVTSSWEYDDDTMTVDYAIGMAAVEDYRRHGLIFWDQDQDTKRERPEPGVPGVTVTACTESGDCVARVQTDEYGCYDLGMINETHIVEVDPDIRIDHTSTASDGDGNYDVHAALGDDLVDLASAPEWVEDPCGVGASDDDPDTEQDDPVTTPEPTRPSVVQTDGGPLRP